MKRKITDPAAVSAYLGMLEAARGKNKYDLCDKYLPAYHSKVKKMHGSGSPWSGEISAPTWNAPKMERVTPCDNSGKQITTLICDYDPRRKIEIR